ncbi:hypothetical protein [Phytoactinopolyspora mesophila]|uniref:Uncharacterized protein n=1 Tax=Phytoactinopolyspora mesophila TaxID=2650750 RepID=A0A7K3M5N3_9ACTN|nr:hypothetical protein [Phytoactinopolyspora mesophila]NDL58555.1 hypothetical protein [Phytoactinopolyspora mesophila]
MPRPAPGKRRTISSGTGLALAAAVSLALPGIAVADLPGGGDDDGYTVAVNVRFSGDAAPGGGGSYTVYVPPICWWEQMPSNNVDPTDPEAVYEYYMEEIRGGGRTPREVLQWPDEEVFLDAIEREENGENITWYWISHRSANRAPCSPQIRDYGDSWNNAIVIYSPFAHNEPPEPAVDPEVLAEAARDRMVIDRPEVDRNPKMAGSNAGATLVNVPTWFWVTNPDSVGGPDGERSIRAEVVGGDVWAEVTARTGGLSISSPSGNTFCDPSVAVVAWGDGASDDDACTVSFSRASVSYPDGYPVTASTEWSATWEGVTQDGEGVGGDLAPLSRQTSVDVPVAEIQSIVRGLR